MYESAILFCCKELKLKTVFVSILSIIMLVKSNMLLLFESDSWTENAH